MLCVHVFFNTNRLGSFTLPVGNVPSCIQFTLSMKQGFPVILSDNNFSTQHSDLIQSLKCSAKNYEKWRFSKEFTEVMFSAWRKPNIFNVTCPDWKVNNTQTITGLFGQQKAWLTVTFESDQEGSPVFTLQFLIGLFCHISSKPAEEDETVCVIFIK